MTNKLAYQKPELVELGDAETLTLHCPCGGRCDCCCGYRPAM